ncbi:MAG: hypothetical protein WBW87_06300, partial [Candidatus Cybelea sp.]
MPAISRAAYLHWRTAAAACLYGDTFLGTLLMVAMSAGLERPGRHATRASGCALYAQPPACVLK